MYRYFIKQANIFCLFFYQYKNFFYVWWMCGHPNFFKWGTLSSFKAKWHKLLPYPAKSLFLSSNGDTSGITSSTFLNSFHFNTISFHVLFQPHRKVIYHIGYSKKLIASFCICIQYFFFLGEIFFNNFCPFLCHHNFYPIHIFVMNLN